MMLFSEVLRDTCWCVRRQDLEALLLADKAHSNFIDSNFHKNGPRRLISFAALTTNVDANDRGFSAKSNGEEKNASSIKDSCCHFRNSLVQRFCLNCAALNVAAVDALKGLKDAYLLDSLDIEVFIRTPEDISLIRLALNDVFHCRTVLCNFYSHPSTEDEFVIAQELMPAILTSSTVSGARDLTLWDIPPCVSSLIADWLHDATGDVPRRLYIWCSYGEFDAKTLAGLLTKKFTNDTCPRRYEFQAGGETMGELGAAPNECLENSNGEVLEIKTIFTYYRELSIKRLRKEDRTS